MADLIGQLADAADGQGAAMDRSPAGKLRDPKKVVKDTTEIVKGIEPLLNRDTLSAFGIKKDDDFKKAQKILEDASEGRVTIPKQYEEANKYLTAFGRELRARRTIAEKGYDDRIQEALRILREEEKDEPMGWGEVAGRIALATAPVMIGALLGPGVGAGAGKGILEGIDASEKRKEAKKERLRKITEFGVESDLKKSAMDLKEISDTQSAIGEARAKLPLSYAEAAATLQQLGMKGMQGRSKDEQDMFSKLVQAIALKAMNEGTDGKGDKDGLTPGQEAADKAFAKDYADWLQLGGQTSARTNIAKLEGAIKEMAGTDMVSGPRIQFVPDVMNAKGTKIREDIQSSIQDTLRQVLGSAYTEREGTMVLSRAFNPALEEKENIIRARRVMNNLKMMGELKQQAIKYFETNGTLKGFSGTEEFDRLYAQTIGDPAQGTADVIRRVDPKTGTVYEYTFNPKTGEYE